MRTREEKVLVQVGPMDEGREIGWGANVAERLQNRLEDIRSANLERAKGVADSLEGLQVQKVGSWGKCRRSLM